MDPREHWERIYRERPFTDVSWYQPHAARSLALIERAVPDRSAPLIDVGGGASTLVDDLLRSGYENVTVLDIAAAALAASRTRVEAADLPARHVRWIHGDVRDVPLPARHYALWHDRAVFHFLTAPADRARYVQRVRESVRPRGVVLVATFAADGPLRCSGLDVVRYDPASLHAEFGDDFRLVGAEREEHTTPGGATQAFTYCLCWLDTPA